MWFKNIFILFFVSIYISESALAQVPVKTDSTHLYENIQNYSKQSKFKMFLYRLIFKPVAARSKKKEVKKKVYRRLVQKPYSAFEGKTIRNIDIVTLDPFGYSATDTAVVKQTFLYKAGNETHVKTRRITIRNLILIHRNEPFDSLLVRESERLIRSQNYVHEVSFYVYPAGKKSDSVDIFIRESDKWSVIPKINISTSNFQFDITDKNFLGSGHEFQNDFTRNFNNGINTFNTNYSIPNIRNTYISAMLHYGVDGYKNFNKSLAVDRPFYSPFAKWAAGVSFASQYKKDSLSDINPAIVPENSKFGTQDYWTGIAHQVFKGNTETKRVTNLIFTLRYLRVRYSEKPSELSDPYHIYSDEDFYLTAIGISTRKYVQDKYVFNYGVVEDVPVGKVFGLTGGYQVKNNSWRRYLGTRFSFGNFYKWGYMSCNFEYGTFYHASYSQQGVFSAGLNYFTNLFEIGNLKCRQFVKPQLTLGINRFPSESITINNENGILGFNSISLLGTKKIVLTLQTQSYAPWKLLGFRFGPYLIYSFGMLGNAASGFKKKQVFSQFCLGVLIKNEFLVINNFQVSVAFYPNIPGKGNNVFKINSNSTTDFGFQDFIIGKPGIVEFQ